MRWVQLCGSLNIFDIAFLWDWNENWPFKLTLKLKKIGKATRLFRCDINHISYNYTVEVRNRFKKFDLIDRVPENLWTEVCDIVQEAGIKTILKKKKYKKAICLSEEALIAEERSEAKGKEEKERFSHLTLSKNTFRFCYSWCLWIFSWILNVKVNKINNIAFFSKQLWLF